MSNSGDDVVAALRSQIENRVRDQLKRHLAINPTGDPRQIVDIQIAQEKERCERDAEKCAEEGRQSLADVYEAIIEWLPQLAQELKLR